MIAEPGEAPPKKAKQQHEKLAAEILEHDRRYYQEDAPVIGDTEYDALVARLKALEDAHPGLRSPESPTQKVGGGLSSTFAPVRHARPMLSLDNTYDAGEIRAWDERVRKNPLGIYVDAINWSKEISPDGDKR